ncbi:MAG: universal stress protein [Kofleriaceae bacterium]
MKLPSRILVPTDFSEHATCALDYAVALAHKLGAKIYLLNAMGLQFAEYPIAVTADMIDSIMRSNQKVLEALIAARAGQADFAPAILDAGDARLIIEQQAIEIGADLIVMGTHGRQGVKRALLGSVAESLARTAPCPVLLVRTNNVPA